jgi:NAD(P)H-hydrate epimerase
VIPFFRDPLPYLTANQMREVDRLMVEVYHIELIQMMENAGRNLAHLARTRFLHDDPQGKRVIVLAGIGGNGGGALVCARWLHNAGAIVRVYLTADHDRLTPIPAHQLDILLQIHIAVARANQIEAERVPDLIVDGIIGYGLNGSPRGDAADLIN